MSMRHVCSLCECHTMACTVEYSVPIHHVSTYCVPQAHGMLCTAGKNRVLLMVLCLTAAGLFCKSKWNLPHLYSQELRECNCPKCLTDGENDFKTQMDASPKPFLSIPSPTSENDFNWWKVVEHFIPVFLSPIIFQSCQSHIDWVVPRSLVHISRY